MIAVSADSDCRGTREVCASGSLRILSALGTNSDRDRPAQAHCATTRAQPALQLARPSLAPSPQGAPISNATATA